MRREEREIRKCLKGVDCATEIRVGSLAKATDERGWKEAMN